MSKTKISFLLLVLAVCGAPGCPSRCKSQDDCGDDETCMDGTDGNGDRGRWCILAYPSSMQAKEAERRGWKIDSATVGVSTSGPNVSVTIKRGE